MRQDERAPFDGALRAARAAAYPAGEFVEQEGFMRAGEIRSLARRAGVGPGVRVLDLCCGVAGPGRLITSETGCDYLGVDLSASAVELARTRATGLGCRFVVGEVPPVPAGPFDVVLLLETMLAFPDKETVLREVAGVLVPGGRFAFTVEEGPPLTAVEAAAMPDADTVWPVPLSELVFLLADAGMEVRRIRESSSSHREVADALLRAFLVERPVLEADLGDGAVADLLAAHTLWRDWLATGRIRKLEVVAVKTGGRRTNG